MPATEFFASPEYLAMPLEEVFSRSNGCGPANWKIDLVPDVLMGVDLEWPCRIHDIDYWLNQDKDRADARFLANCALAVKRHHEDGIIGAIKDHALYLLRMNLVVAYYISVSVGGQDAWDACKRIVQ